MRNETFLTTMKSSVTTQRDFEYCPLYSFQGQYLGHECEYGNHISTAYMTKDDFNKLDFSKVKVRHSVTRWRWYLNGHSFVKFNVGHNHGYVPEATTIWFHFWFSKSPETVSDGHIRWYWMIAKLKDIWSSTAKSNQWRKLRHIAYYCNDDEDIDSITLGRWKISDFSLKQLSASLVMSEWWYNVSHFSLENAFVNSVYKLAAIVCQGVGDMWLMDLRIWKVYRLVSNIRRTLVCN